MRNAPNRRPRRRRPDRHENGVSRPRRITPPPWRRTHEPEQDSFPWGDSAACGRYTHARLVAGYSGHDGEVKLALGDDACLHARRAEAELRDSDGAVVISKRFGISPAEGRSPCLRRHTRFRFSMVHPDGVTPSRLLSSTIMQPSAMSSVTWSRLLVGSCWSAKRAQARMRCALSIISCRGSF
jgi:hypothetical protein